MPSEISDAGIRFPVGYSPWYVYEATIAASETFEFMDVLIPTSGVFSRLETDDAILASGYVFALEAIETAVATTTVIQVAVPGSLVPFIAGEDSVEPEELVKFNFTGGKQSMVSASATDLAAGRVMGRYRNQNTNAQNLRLADTDDIIYVLSGVI